MGNRWTSSLFFVTIVLLPHIYSDITESRSRDPTVMVAILVRNKASILPWFFGHLEQLNYPKHRMTIWIRSDHNEDNTASILREWTKAVAGQYKEVDLKIDERSTGYDDSEGPMDWSPKRFAHVSSLREDALQTARKLSIDYLFMLDADAILENPETLNLLIDAKQLIVAPMLKSSLDNYLYQPFYSNFWCSVQEYQDCEEIPWYSEIGSKTRLGMFRVPLVHTDYIIDMQMNISRSLSYVSNADDYKGPRHNIVTFAQNVRAAGLGMDIINTEHFGIAMVPMERHETLEDESDHFDYVRTEAYVDAPGLIQSLHVKVADKKPSTLGFDKIYMVNLLRRPERRMTMKNTMKVMGIDVEIVEAIDGKQLNATYVKSLGVKIMEDYRDMLEDRTTMTMGEIGLFLTNMNIWKDIVKNNYDKAIIFEDDVRFQPYFTRKLKTAMSQVEALVPNWDLLYLGRKPADLDAEEPYVEGSDCLQWPYYSYWTVAYALSGMGAKKLIDRKPHEKMIPLDDFLSIMYDQFPNERWKSLFAPRNLVALAVSPEIALPSHFTGEPSHISDTEDSSLLQAEDIQPKEISADSHIIPPGGRDEL